jgi:single-stranded-DNA-specific exonuclease
VLAELLLRNGLAGAGAVGQFPATGAGRAAGSFPAAQPRAGATRLRQAIAGREDVVVLGDYDVDGVSSTALLVSVLRRFGLQPRFVVPRRSEDGYGLSRSAIDRALEQGRPILFIALDCGTNSLAEVDYLVGQGIDVIVIDHHRSKEQTLERGLLINPHVCSDEAGMPMPGGAISARSAWSSSSPTACSSSCAPWRTIRWPWASS